MKNRKIDHAMSNLLSRQDYLVTQANDLAKAFGSLTTFEHKVLDFCFSYVQASDDVNTVYQVNSKDILRHLDLNQSGNNYHRVIKAFKGLNEKTAIYMLIHDEEGNKGILMTSLFDSIEIMNNGKTKFSFSRKIAPYVFQLKKNFYSFKLSELGRIKSKYALSLLKLWNANSHGKLQNVHINGSLDDWEAWLLRVDKNGIQRKWPAGRFKQQALIKAITEIEHLYPQKTFSLYTEMDGRKVVGYSLCINDNQNEVGNNGNAR